MDIFELAKARILAGGGGKGFYSTEENDAGGTTYVFKAAKDGHFVKEKDVNFYDYDGTLLHSYTVAEAQALTELPPLPAQKGLVCQGWNWTLDNIKVHNRAVDVGATYITDDGKTRIYISIGQEDRMTVSLNLRFGDWYKNLTIDWGDGFTQNDASYLSHEYTSAGDYVITIEVTNGNTLQLGDDNDKYGIVNGGFVNTLDIYQCTIKKVEIGSGVTIIPQYAFYGCYNLQSITIPNSVTSIGIYAFNLCNSLKSATIPDGVTSVDERAFSSCHSLSTVAVPSSVTIISKYAFYNCYSLQSITIPDSVTSIGVYAFNSCYSLKRVTIPDGVMDVGNYTFCKCYSLQSVTIPDSVASIGNYAFEYCQKLKNIIIPDMVTIIGDYAFEHCYILSDITIPDGVTSIGKYAFRNCYGFSRITIPDSVTSIGEYAFNNCKTATSISIGNGVTSIPANVFGYCSSFTRCVVSSSVMEIAANAFYLLESTVVFDFTSHKAVPTLKSTNAFSTNTGRYEGKFLVPAALYEEWIAATNWSSFADQIVAV